MRKPNLLAVAIAAIAVLMVPGVAGARATFETDLDIETSFETAGGSGQFLVAGVLGSEKAKCLAGRRIRLLADFTPMKRGSNAEVLDSARSSQNGAWGVQAAFADFKGAELRVKVLKEDIGKNTCEADAEGVTL